MRDGTRWAEARELFLDLADLSVAERQQPLAELRARDPDLADWVNDLLLQDEAARARPAARPARLGPYEIVRTIGRGGMGEVCVARRVDGAYEREVAIKRLHKGLASEEMIRRFLRERQTLARLDHEYIARLLDGGTSEDGEPYLVMEFVEGEPADVFAARLDLRERLELFLRIGRAVAHAHERGFVHRDLKPSNILVRADGAPRLLDFGIARLDLEARPASGGQDEPLTRTGNRLFTPEYASPEQVRGEVATVRSDVFALGVVLYEFVSGARPWNSDKGLHALELEICEQEPVTPGRRVRETSRGHVSGDLDAIVLQCLAKRPQDRYASVTDLCEDVQRFLRGEPIRARRIGVLGRITRYARRRPAHAAAAALLVVALIASAIAWSTRRADDRRRGELRAAVEDRLASAVSYHQNGALDDARAEIEAALTALRELPGEHALEAEALSYKAVFASQAHDWRDTHELVDLAFARLEDVAAPDPMLVARLMNSRAYALQMDEPGERSEKAYRAARDYTFAHLHAGHVLRVDAILGCAQELRRVGRVAESIRELEEALGEARSIDDPRRAVVARTLNDLAAALVLSKRYDEASARYGEALEILGWNHGERHPSLAVVRFNLGASLFRAGRFDEAEEQLRRSLAISREADLPVLVGNDLQLLARVQYLRGELAESETAVREAIGVYELAGPEAALNQSRLILGIVLAAAGRTTEARALLAPLLDGEAGFPADLEADAAHRLGVALHDAGELEAARPHLERALRVKRELLGPDHADCAELAQRLAAGR